MHHASGAFSFILLLHHQTANLLLLTILIIKCTGSSSGQHVDDVLQHSLLVVIKFDFLHYLRVSLTLLQSLFINSSMMR